MGLIPSVAADEDVGGLDLTSGVAQGSGQFEIGRALVSQTSLVERFTDPRTHQFGVEVCRKRYVDVGAFRRHGFVTFPWLCSAGQWFAARRRDRVSLAPTVCAGRGTTLPLQRNSVWLSTPHLHQCSGAFEPGEAGAVPAVLAFQCG